MMDDKIPSDILAMCHEEFGYTGDAVRAANLIMKERDRQSKLVISSEEQRYRVGSSLVNENVKLHMEIVELRMELAATYDELIEYNGDDLNDTRQNRASKLRTF